MVMTSTLTSQWQQRDQNPPHFDELNVAIQNALNILNYNAGKTDGIYGPKTMAAIKAFQQDYELSIDGKASYCLFNSLYHAKVNLSFT